MRITASIFAILSSAVLSGQTTQRRPFIIAHYMHCYVLGAMRADDPRVQRPSTLMNLLTWPPIDEESEWFAPSLAAIAASGSSATVKDFENAQNAGVDAFGLLISPSHLPNSQFSHGLHLVASVAGSQHLKIVPELWSDPWTTDYKLYGHNVKAFMDAHPLAFQKWNGKPMFIFEFDELGKHYSAVDQRLAVQKLADFVAPWGSFGDVYIILYVSWDVEKHLTAPIFSKADAVSIWTPQDDWSALHSRIIAESGPRLHKDFVWPVSPAFYQRRAGAKPMEYGNSFGAAKYIDAWHAAISLHPMFIEIQTWNDFSEDSAVVPSNTNGETFVELTRYFSTWAKTGNAPTLAAERVMLFRPKQLEAASIRDPTARVTNAAWRHKTPTVDYLDIVTQLKSTALARLTLGGQVWEHEIPAGFYEWIVYAKQTAAMYKPGEVIANDESYPEQNAQRAVTAAEHFSAGTPEVELTRGNQVVSRIQSRVPFLASGPFQDFTLIGDTSTAIH